MATFAFIRAGQYADTPPSHTLLADHQDLIHKACGWMLRAKWAERDAATLRSFLDAHTAACPAPCCAALAVLPDVRAYMVQP